MSAQLPLDLAAAASRFASGLGRRLPVLKCVSGTCLAFDLERPPRSSLVIERGQRKPSVQRQTVNLAQFPDLVVIYLGMRVRKLRGVHKLLRTGRQIQAAVVEQPDGLLRHENLLFSLVPPHLAMRQYWRDLDALERWTRELPHRAWWQDFLRDSAGTGFWHETYFMRGGMEAIYDDISEPIGMMCFAPLQDARGRMFTARNRLGLREPRLGPVVSEGALSD